MKRIVSLDGLRGIFCLLIVFEHYSPVYLPSIIYEFPLIRHSYIVVDFFFVLSGYILALKYWDNIIDFKSLKKFYLKRLFRLYPLVLLTSSLMFLIELITHFNFKNVKNEAIGINEIFLRYFNDIFLINSSNVLGAYAMNIPSWSISAEFFCYLLFGVYLLWFKKVKYLMHFSLLVFIIISLYNNIGFSTFKFGYIRGIISFLIGVILFKEEKSFNFNSRKNYQYIIIILFSISLYLLKLKIVALNSFLSIALPFFFMLSIHNILTCKGFLTKFLNAPLITRIGELSFSIYLNHFLVVLILPRLVFQIFQVPNIAFYQIIVFILCPIIVITISKFTNKYIEVSFNNYLRQKFN